MKNLYQPYSVPAMSEPAPLEKRLRHILFGRGGYTMRHALIPIVLGVVALGALLPLRPKTQTSEGAPTVTAVEVVKTEPASGVADAAVAAADSATAVADSAVAVADSVAPMAADAPPAPELPEAPEAPESLSTEELRDRAAQLETELAHTRALLAQKSVEQREQLLHQKELRLQQVEQAHQQLVQAQQRLEALQDQGKVQQAAYR